MKYIKKMFGYSIGLGTILASPKITEYALHAYTYLGGSTDVPFLDHNQSLNAIKFGLEALIVYMGVKVIIDS